MKSILRKATALFLSMLMCISGVPLNALAETMTDVSGAFTLPIRRKFCVWSWSPAPL